VAFANRGDCDDLSFSELQGIEVQIYVSNAPNCQGHPACATGVTCAGHSGHSNCQSFVIEIAGFLFQGALAYQNNAINHEVGHALGLADPECVEEDGNCTVDKDASDCWIAFWELYLFYGAFPISSVMHTTGFCCPDIDRHQANGTLCTDHWPPGDLPFPSRGDMIIARLIAGNHPWVAGN
jgi:hypothetical protein